MILIEATEIREDARKRMLLEDDEEFDLEYLDTKVYDGKKLRCFRLSQNGKNCGIVYENWLDPKVLELL